MLLVVFGYHPFPCHHLFLPCLLCASLRSGSLGGRIHSFSTARSWSKVVISTIVISFFTLSNMKISGLLYFTWILVGILVSTLISIYRMASYLLILRQIIISA